MRVMGVDPGTHTMGVGVVDASGDELTLVHYETLDTDASEPLSARLFGLYDALSRIMTAWRPDEVAVEAPFVARNSRSAIAVGQAQAVALIAAAGHGLPVATYAPAAVKRAVTDYGRSSKAQVQQMVAVLLRLDRAVPSLDANDALAVALCHVNSRRVQRLVESGQE